MTKRERIALALVPFVAIAGALAFFGLRRQDGPGCGEISDHYWRIAPSDQREQLRTMGMKDPIRERCEGASWNKSQRECLMRANDEPGFFACVGGAAPTVSPPERAASASPPRARNLNVDDDCYEANPLVCDGSRLEAAERLANAIGHAAAKTWWWRCFKVSVVAGDSEPDAIVISVQEERGGTCAEGEDRAVSKTKIKQVANKVSALIAGDRDLARGADTLMVTNGWGAEVRVRLP